MSGSRLIASVGLAFALAAGGSAQQKKAPAPYAIVEGTVFKDPGLALPGAKVVLTLRDDVKSKKLQEAETNYRGEFLFRVAPAEAKYLVKASLKGFFPDEKEAAVSGEERVSVNLVLVPIKK